MRRKLAAVAWFALALVAGACGGYLYQTTAPAAAQCISGSGPRAPASAWSPGCSIDTLCG